MAGTPTPIWEQSWVPEAERQSLQFRVRLSVALIGAALVALFGGLLLPKGSQLSVLIELIGIALFVGSLVAFGWTQWYVRRLRREAVASAEEHSPSPGAAVQSDWVPGDPWLSRIPPVLVLVLAVSLAASVAPSPFRLPILGTVAVIVACGATSLLIPRFIPTISGVAWSSDGVLMRQYWFPTIPVTWPQVRVRSPNDVRLDLGPIRGQVRLTALQSARLLSWRVAPAGSP